MIDVKNSQPPLSSLKHCPIYLGLASVKSSFPLKPILKAHFLKLHILILTDLFQIFICLLLLFNLLQKKFPIAIEVFYWYNFHSMELKILSPCGDVFVAS